MRLLLVEDEPDMAALLRGVLEKHDFVLDSVPSIEIAIEAIETIAQHEIGGRIVARPHGGFTKTVRGDLLAYQVLCDGRMLLQLPD